MLINEIFKSISGEAARAGFPVIFIRTHGCNLRCTYCDTMYAVEGVEFDDLTPQRILDRCNELRLKRVVLTGGEPLIQKDAAELVDLLCNNGFEVEIETNGSIDLDEFSKKLTTRRCDLMSYTMDFKSFSSGMSGHMVAKNIEFLTGKDVIKFVAGNKDDLDQMRTILDTFNITCQVFVSPIFGDIKPKDIVQYLLDNNLQDVRMQLQMHKFIWPVEMRGV